MLGFGFGMTTMALLSMALGVKSAVPVVAGLALVVNGGLLFRFRRSFPAREAAPLLLAALSTIPLGVFALSSLPAERLLLVLGCVLLAYVAWALTRRDLPTPLGARAGVALGLLSGTLGGAFSAAGPPAVVWVSSQPWDSRRLRATLVGLFALGGLLQVPLLVRAGLIDGSSLALSAIAIPTAGLGSLGGAALGDRVPQEQFRRLMLVGLGVLAAVFIARGVTGG